MATMSDKPLSGKTAVVLGVANKRSIAWAVAQAWYDAGATLIFSYQGERLKDNVAELVSAFGEDVLLAPCDVSKDEEIKSFFDFVRSKTDKVDLLLHSVAFAPREALAEPFVQTSREAFAVAHDVSVYSLIATTREVVPMMKDGGSIMTMTFRGSVAVYPNYNVMGVAKAALEASVRYLAHNLGPQKIRVNAISAGPVQTLAARGISDFSTMIKTYQDNAPLGRSCSPDELGQTALFLASDGASGITGQVIYVDGGYSIMGA
jgi:enoyl-[acyl-carrier protein] reductase I